MELVIHSHSRGLTYTLGTDNFTYLGNSGDDTTIKRIQTNRCNIVCCTICYDRDGVGFDFTQLSQYSEIRTLEVSQHSDSELDLSILATLPKLESVSLDGYFKNLYGLEFCGCIQSLHLAITPDLDFSILTHLSPSSLSLKDGCLEALGMINRERLVKLQVSNKLIAFRALRRVMPIPNLTKLRLASYYADDLVRSDNGEVTTDIHREATAFEGVPISTQSCTVINSSLFDKFLVQRYGVVGGARRFNTCLRMLSYGYLKLLREIVDGISGSPDVKMTLDIPGDDVELARVVEDCEAFLAFAASQ